MGLKGWWGGAGRVYCKAGWGAGGNGCCEVGSEWGSCTGVPQPQGRVCGRARKAPPPSPPAGNAPKTSSNDGSGSRSAVVGPGATAAADAAALVVSPLLADVGSCEQTCLPSAGSFVSSTAIASCPRGLKTPREEDAATVRQPTASASLRIDSLHSLAKT